MNDVAAYQNSDGIRLRDLKFVDLFLSEDGSHGWMKNSNTDAGSILLPEHRNQQDFTTLLEMCRHQESQNGWPEYLVRHDEVNYRVSSFVSTDGVYRVFRKQPIDLRKLDALGLQTGLIRGLMVKNIRGLILIAGKSQSGKTTTASAILAARLSHYGGVGITIEDPPEMPLTGQHGDGGMCFQTFVSRGNGNTFASALERTVRMSPDIILLGEIRDNETAAEAIKASINGHLVVATIHAGTPIEAIQRIIIMGGAKLEQESARNLLSDGIFAVITQNIIDGKLLAQSLFFLGEDAKGMRAKIRKDETHQLVQEIEAQAAVLARNS